EHCPAQGINVSWVDRRKNKHREVLGHVHGKSPSTVLGAHLDRGGDYADDSHYQQPHPSNAFHIPPSRQTTCRYSPDPQSARNRAPSQYHLPHIFLTDFLHG